MVNEQYKTKHHYENITTAHINDWQQAVFYPLVNYRTITKYKYIGSRLYNDTK